MASRPACSPRRGDASLPHAVGSPGSTGTTGENRGHTVMAFHPNVPEQHGAAGEGFVTGWRKAHAFDRARSISISLAEQGHLNTPCGRTQAS